MYQGCTTVVKCLQFNFVVQPNHDFATGSRGGGSDEGTNLVVVRLSGKMVTNYIFLASTDSEM